MGLPVWDEMRLLGQDEMRLPVRMRWSGQNVDDEGDEMMGKDIEKIRIYIVKIMGCNMCCDWTSPW